MERRHAEGDRPSNRAHGDAGPDTRLGRASVLVE
jgi:hypothetical protein